MKTSKITREQAFELLKKYNKDPFHIRHALTVEGVMKYYADKLGYGEDMIYSVCSHGYGICCDVKPIHEMEKVLFAADELTGLIWSTALMRPSKSVMDMEVSSLKKKFKDKKFAAGCSREVIKTGAESLGWELDRLFEETILAMRSCESEVAEYMDGYRN